MKLLVATRNRHKLVEIRDILNVPGLELLAADEVPGLPDVEEDGVTFEANALKKAVMLARASGMWTVADDSGLEVEALGGAPGVRSARYAGEPSDDAANNRKLLRELDGVSGRSARFCCVIGLSDPAGRTRTVQGTRPGRIVEKARGSRGFGYDPLFIPDGYDETFGEMEPDRKNRISHRAAALRKAAVAWQSLFAG